MAKDSAYRKKGITPEKAAIYIERKLQGRSVKEVAENHGVTGKTVWKYCKDFDEFLRESPEYQEAANRLTSMLPKALDVYERTMDHGSLMGNPDVTVATNVIKVAGFLKDRNVNEQKMGDMSEADLAQFEERIVARIIEAREKGLDKLEEDQQEAPKNAETREVS